MCIFAEACTAIGCSITVYNTTDEDVANSLIYRTEATRDDNYLIASALLRSSSLPVGVYEAGAVDVESDGTVPPADCRPVRMIFSIQPLLILTDATPSDIVSPTSTSKLRGDHIMYFC